VTQVPGEERKTEKKGGDSHRQKKSFPPQPVAFPIKKKLHRSVSKAKKDRSAALGTMSLRNWGGGTRAHKQIVPIAISLTQKSVTTMQKKRDAGDPEREASFKIN